MIKRGDKVAIDNDAARCDDQVGVVKETTHSNALVRLADGRSVMLPKIMLSRL